MCPDWELSLRPFGLQTDAQSYEPHQPGPTSHLLKFILHRISENRQTGGHFLSAELHIYVIYLSVDRFILRLYMYEVLFTTAPRSYYRSKLALGPKKTVSG